MHTFTLQKTYGETYLCYSPNPANYPIFHINKVPKPEFYKNNSKGTYINTNEQFPNI